MMTKIYDDKIAIIIWNNVPEAVIIHNAHNKDAALLYKNYFDFMWKNAIVPRKK